MLGPSRNKPLITPNKRKNWIPNQWKRRADEEWEYQASGPRSNLMQSGQRVSGYQATKMPKIEIMENKGREHMPCGKPEIEMYENEKQANELNEIW